MEFLPQGGLIFLSALSGALYGLGMYLPIRLSGTARPGAYALMCGASFALLSYFAFWMIRNRLMKKYTRLEMTLGKIILKADAVFYDENAPVKKLKRRVGRVYVTADALVLVSFGEKPYLTERLPASDVAFVTAEENNAFSIALKDGRVFRLAAALRDDILSAAARVGIEERENK